MDLKHKLFDVPKISSIQDMVLMIGKDHAGKLALEDLNDTPIKKLPVEKLLDIVFLLGTGF